MTILQLPVKVFSEAVVRFLLMCLGCVVVVLPIIITLDMLFATLCVIAGFCIAFYFGATCGTLLNMYGTGIDMN